MNSQQLLLLNFVILLILVLYFVLGRSKPKQNSLLSLKNSRQNEEITPPLPAIETQPARVIEVLPQPEAVKEPLTTQEPPEVIEIVYFIYNGHEWEAHEVLGLASGVTLEVATKHYQNLIKTSDSSTFEFYEAAFTAILNLKRSKW